MAEAVRTREKEGVAPSEGRTEAARMPEALLVAEWLRPEAMADANEAIARGLTGIGQEVGRFVCRRLQADMEAARALYACENLETALKTHRDFLGTAMIEYAEETRTLADLASTMIRESLASSSAPTHH
jgi:hypothetical protein